MTISTTIIKNSYSGNGSTSAFTYNFKITDEDDIQVIIRSANGTETVKTITTHYTVGGVGGNSGTVTFTSGNIPVTGETVVLRRSTPQTQAMDLIDNDPMSADTIETAHDKVTSISQELQEQVDRSIKLSRTNTMTSTEFTVDATNRANKILAFDSAGEISVTQELGTFVGNWAASTSYNARDLVKDTSTNNIFICTTSHTSSGSQPLTTNTDSAKWSLIVDAASATTAQTAAAASATAAAASAAAALTSENNSSTSETNSANSATASANSATASAASASAASTSETNSATSETNSAASATAASASQSAAASSATAASSSQTAAASSASAAATSEANSLTYSNNSSTSATNSANSATASASSASSASTSASNAASSATAAQTAQAAAEAAADNFDDTYLGAKTSDPTTDNDGDALNAGDLYFNSNTNVLRVYNGSSWQDAAVDTTTFATKGFATAMSIAL
jgi:hypothetical protein